MEERVITIECQYDNKGLDSRFQSFKYQQIFNINS